MIATLLVALPLAAAALCLVPRAARWIVAGAALASAVLAAYAAAAAPPSAVRVPWIPALGATYAVDVDGLAGSLAAASGLLVAVAAAVSARVPDRRAYFALLAVLLAAVDGALVSRDLLLFFVFWEALLVTIAVLVRHWGAGRADGAVRRFVAPALLADALLLVTIVSLAGLRGSADVDALARRPLAAAAQLAPLLLMLPAFATRLAVFPLHSWGVRLQERAPLPIALVLAPALELVALAATVRFSLGLFPDALAAAAPLLVSFCAVGSVYTALIALRQDHPRRLVAYLVLSQQSLVALGLFAASGTSVTGSVVLAVSVGLAAAALLLSVDGVGSRTAPFPLVAPAIAAFAAVPGSATFAGAVLVLAGTYARYPVAASIAAAGLFVVALGGLSLVRRRVHGPVPTARAARRRDWLLVAPLLAIVLVLGVVPALLTDRLPADLVRVGAPR